jgi:hypothetical protein
MTVAVAGLQLAGCATGGAHSFNPPLESARATAETKPEKEALGLSVQSIPLDPHSIAASAMTPEDCVQRAVDARRRSVDAGWEILKACVERSKYDRMRYLGIPSLLDGTWDSDLATRPDAPAVIANFVARRGGDVNSDLPQFHKARVPIFTLSTAFEQPDVYKGRLVLVSALLEARKDGKKTQLQLSELAVGAQGTEYDVRNVRWKKTHTSTGTVQGGRNSSYNNQSASTSYNGKYNNEETWTTSKTRVRYDNTFKPTGTRAVAKFVNQDPFMLPGKQYMFLARFDGVLKVRLSDDEYDQRTDTFALVTVLQHFPISAAAQE